MSAIQNRYDFVYLFDCQDGNPNGDPDSDNSPRIDPETFQGLISDVCLKRKIRDYVYYSQQDANGILKGYDLLVLSGHTLESRQKRPYDNLKDIKAAGSKTTPGDISRARAWMCENFFDVRAFGAVMSTTEYNCGQVRGPVQVTFARSIDRVLTTEHTITRQAFTGEKDVKSGTGTMGRKHTVAYGLYRAHGFLNPVFAGQTGFSQSDLALLWRALGNLFDIDHSASRGLMAARALVVFEHESRLGNAPAHELFETVKVKARTETPRSFSDYEISLPVQDKLPAGVKVIYPIARSAAA